MQHSSHSAPSDLSTEAAVRYLLDRFAIQDLIANYGLGQDLHQGDNPDQNVLAQWADVFAPDATIDASELGIADPLSLTQYAELLRGPGLRGGTGMPVWFRAWQHREGYATVTLAGDNATAISPFLHSHETRTGDASLFHFGLWFDQLERRPEGWRITHRRLQDLYFHTFQRIPNPETV